MAAAEVEGVAQALGLQGAVSKSGYLTKLAKKSQSNWKKRFFVLSGQTLTYYVDHSDKTAKGNVLLTENTTVKMQEGKNFVISNGFESMTVAANTEEEAKDWVNAIEATVQDEVRKSVRGYLEIQVAQLMGKKFQKRFFMLHLNSITSHKDYDTTHKNLGIIKLTITSNVKLEDDTLTILESVDSQKVHVLREPPQSEREKRATLTEWKIAIEKTIEAIRSMSELSVQPGEQNNDTAVKDGYLETRDEKTNQWVGRFYALTSTALYMAEAEDSKDAIKVFPLNPSCSVFETNLKPNAFELVTSREALHMQASTPEDTQEWITSLRSVISKSTVSNKDPLANGAKKIAGAKLENLEKYDVHFEVKKPLGIVLERSREWALVKLSNVQSNNTKGGSGGGSASNTVTEGSALYAVNDETVILQPYAQCIKVLTGWKPPLKLTFIRAPTKEGWLAKMSRGRDTRKKAFMGSSVNWRQRYFILKQGKLAYFAIDQDTPELKGCVQLMGSGVSLVSADEIGKNFCFKLVSGVATLYMQAENLEDMMTWAATLYHAIAVANGGGYLLDVARGVEAQRVREKQAAAAKEAEAKKKAAEEMAIKAAEAKATAEKAAAEKAAEAEAQAKAEAEAVAAAEAAAAAESEAEAAKEAVEDLQVDLAEMELEESTKKKSARKRTSVLSALSLNPSVLPEDSEDPVDGTEVSQEPPIEVQPLYQIATNTSAVKEEEIERSRAESSLGNDDEDTNDPTMQAVVLQGYGSEDPLDATDEEISRAFSVLDASGKGQLNPMQFSNLLRAAGVSMHNMHTEMSWYRMFDTDGQVGISLEDIKHGIHAMNKENSIKATTKQLFVTYIKTLGASSVMSL